MQLQKYDLILCKGNKSPISALIRWFTKEEYSHCEIYIGNYHIIDAMPNGVKIREMDRSLGKFDAYRYTKGISAKQGKMIEEFLQKALNSKYDFKELIMQAFNKRDTDKRKYICITLAMEAFRYAGLDVGEWRRGFAQVTQSKNFKKINK